MNNYVKIILTLILFTCSMAQAQDKVVGIGMDGSLEINTGKKTGVQIRVDAKAVRPKGYISYSPYQWRINDHSKMPNGSLLMHGSLDVLSDPYSGVGPRPCIVLTIQVIPVENGFRYVASVKSVPEAESVESIALVVEGASPDVTVTAVGDNAGSKRYPLEPKVGSEVSITAQCDRSDLQVDLNWYAMPEEFRKAFANPDGVVSLGSWGTRVQSLPDTISKLKDLKSLGIGGETLRELPEEIGELSNLQKISISNGATISKLPESIGNCQNLKSITMYGLRWLRELPPSIGRLKQLKSLGILHCNLEAFPDEIGNCTALEFIKNPDNRSFRYIPDSFGNLVKLRYLNLGGPSPATKVTRLPENMGNLTALEFFVISGPIEHVSDSFDNLTSLVVFGISHARLSTLPSAIGGHEDLRSMFFQNNTELQTIACRLDALPSLSLLDLNDCTILENMPESIGAAQQLRCLDLGKTSLEKLPGSMEKLSDLVALRVPQPVTSKFRRFCLSSGKHLMDGGLPAPQPPARSCGTHSTVTPTNKCMTPETLLTFP